MHVGGVRREQIPQHQIPQHLELLGGAPVGSGVPSRPLRRLPPWGRAPNASMAYWGTMRNNWWLAVSAAVSLALGGCSSPDESKKEAARKPAPKIEKTPEVFQAVFDTSKGKVAIEVHRDWAPIGVDHFYSLIQTGFYDGRSE